MNNANTIMPCPACSGDARVIDYVTHDRGGASGSLVDCEDCGGTGLERCFYKLACRGEDAVCLVDGWPSCEACKAAAASADTLPAPADGDDADLSQRLASLEAGIAVVRQAKAAGEDPWRALAAARVRL